MIKSNSLPSAWDSLIRVAANGQQGFVLHPTESIGHQVEVTVRTLSERIPLAAAGFQSRRWLRYVDDYLGGGPSFVKFLQKYVRRPQTLRYVFHGSQKHTAGSCLRSITLLHGIVPPQRIQFEGVESPMIYLRSRACDLCPTAVLDLTLLWWVSQVTGITSASWEIERAKLAVWQCVARRDIVQVTQRTKLGPTIERYLEDAETQPLSSIKFARARSVLQRRTFFGSVDEEQVILNPVRINPNDLQLIYGVKRTDIQGFLKDTYGWSAGGTGNISYSWSSYDDPIFHAVMKRFRLDWKRLPAIETVAERRASRFAASQKEVV